VAIRIEIEQTKAAVRIVVRGELSAHTARRLLDAADPSRNACSTIELDLSAVERMDTAGAATLVELLRRAQKAKKELKVLALSEAARARLRLVRVLSLFETED